jgi:hypothetical protein
MYLHECGLFLAACGATDLRNGFVATGAIESQQDQRKHLPRKDSTHARSRSFRWRISARGCAVGRWISTKTCFSTLNIKLHILKMLREESNHSRAWNLKFHKPTCTGGQVGFVCDGLPFYGVMLRSMQQTTQPLPSFRPSGLGQAIAAVTNSDTKKVPKQAPHHHINHPNHLHSRLKGTCGPESRFSGLASSASPELPLHDAGRRLSRPAGSPP